MMRAGISPDTGEAKQGQHRVNIGLVVGLADGLADGLALYYPRVSFDASLIYLELKRILALLRGRRIAQVRTEIHRGSVSLFGPYLVLSYIL